MRAKVRERLTEPTLSVPSVRLFGPIAAVI